MSLGDKTYNDIMKDMFKSKRESLLPTAEDMQVDRAFMLAVCEDEGHHRTGQGSNGRGYAVCYCGDSMVLFVKT